MLSANEASGGQHNDPFLLNNSLSIKICYLHWERKNVIGFRDSEREKLGRNTHTWTYILFKNYKEEKPHSSSPTFNLIVKSATSVLKSFPATYYLYELGQASCANAYLHEKSVYRGI